MGPPPFCLIYLFSFPHPSHPPFLSKGHPKLVKALAKLYGTLMGREIDPLKEVWMCVLLCLHVQYNSRRAICVNVSSHPSLPPPHLAFFPSFLLLNPFSSTFLSLPSSPVPSPLKVIITHGAYTALSHATRAFLNPGDEVSYVGGNIVFA